MAKWSGCVSQIVPVPVDTVWKIASFSKLNEWDPTTIQSSALERGDGYSFGSVRRVVFKYPNGSTGSLYERLTYYDAKVYLYCYDMDFNPFRYWGYSSKFKLEDCGDGTTKVNWSFEMDRMEDAEKDSIVGTIKSDFQRKISLLEIRATEQDS